MSEKPISPLRRRMIEDMTVRNFVEKSGRWCPVMGWRLDEFAIQISMLRLARPRGFEPLTFAFGDKG
jgi:hypothetical protein